MWSQSVDPNAREQTTQEVIDSLRLHIKEEDESINRAKKRSRRPMTEEEVSIRAIESAILRNLKDAFVEMIEQEPEKCAKIYKGLVSGIVKFGPEIAKRFVELANYGTEDFNEILEDSACSSRVKTYNFFRALGGSVAGSIMSVRFFFKEHRSLEMLRMLDSDGANLSKGCTMKDALYDEAYQCVAFLDCKGVPLNGSNSLYADRLAVFRARVKTSVKTIRIACTEAMYRPGGAGFLRARDHFHALASQR